MQNAHLRNLGIPVFAAAVMGMVLWVNAGPLAPPVGPVTSTGRFGPRTEIHAADLPLAISSPGSYYLAENIVAAGDGITIDADDVTIDLMGFALTGGSGDGIRVIGNHKNITLRSGTISNWAGYGINAFSIKVGTASNSQFRDLIVTGNRSSGIAVFQYCIVADCTANENGGNGISVNSGSVVRNCTANRNSDGIFAGTNCTITGCAAGSNTFSGIFGSNGCTVIHCTSFDNDDGISTGAGTIVTNCTAYKNNGDGISAGSGSTVSNCAATDNDGHGIRVFSGTHVVNNHCSGNGFQAGDGAGIRATADTNRIEGNEVTENDRGIDVDGKFNLIIGNTARGNTGSGSPSADYDIINDNRHGPIVDVSAVSGDISGTVNADHPWANFTY